jgi:hypothetical protein
MKCGRSDALWLAGCNAGRGLYSPGRYERHAANGFKPDGAAFGVSNHPPEIARGH